MAEDLDSVGEALQDGSDVSRESIAADYKARAASLRRAANRPPLTPRPASRKLLKKKPSAVSQSGSQDDAGHPSSETCCNPKQP
jgi:hypothetical protein